MRDVELGRGRRRARVDIEERAGLLDEPGVGLGLAGIRMIDEDGAGRHAPILARMASSKEKSTGRSRPPARLYQAQVWASAEASV